MIDIDIDIIGPLFSIDAEEEVTLLPGWHVNVTRDIVAARPDLEPYAVEPTPLRRVWAGDEDFAQTACLAFKDEAEAKALLGDLWPESPPPVVESEPVPIDLDAEKSRWNAAVTARREAVFAGGFTPSQGTLAGHTLQVRDEADKINWLTSATSYSLAVVAGHGSVEGAIFRTMDNDTVVLTYAEAVKVIAQDMAAWGQTIMQWSWALKDRIDAATDLAALEAIDIETGWPG